MRTVAPRQQGPITPLVSEPCRTPTLPWAHLGIQRLPWADPEVHRIVGQIYTSVASLGGSTHPSSSWVVPVTLQLLERIQTPTASLGESNPLSSSWADPVVLRLLEGIQ